MVASPETTKTGQIDPLRSIVREALREFAGLEAKLAQLGDRVVAALADAEQERGSVQQFIDAFALEQEIQQMRQTARADEAVALFDIDHIQRERRDLEERVGRARALRSNLDAIAQVIRTCKEQLHDERVFRAPETADDVRIQQAMNAAREEERRRLAREIHDGPAQVLANAIFVVGIADQVVKREPDKVNEQLGDLKILLKDGVAEIRRYMFDLRPSMLEDQGLAPTLRYYVGEYNRMFAKRVDLAMREPLPPLSDDEELCIFRIVQEALQNIQKHAETDEAWIRLDCEDGDADRDRRIELTVTDHGRGFNPATKSPRQGSGAGMPGMRERAKLIGAELSFESEPGRGTTVRLKLPRPALTRTVETRDPPRVS